MMIAIEQLPRAGLTIYPARLVAAGNGRYDLEQIGASERVDTLDQARRAAWRMARDQRADTVIEIGV